MEGGLRGCDEASAVELLLASFLVAAQLSFRLFSCATALRLEAELFLRFDSRNDDPEDLWAWLGLGAFMELVFEADTGIRGGGMLSWRA